MTPRRDAEDEFLRSCQGKKRYRSPELAGRVAARRAVQGLRVYGPCAFCSGFHLTSKTIEEFTTRPR